MNANIGICVHLFAFDVHAKLYWQYYYFSILWLWFYPFIEFDDIPYFLELKKIIIILLIYGFT